MFKKSNYKKGEKKERKGDFMKKVISLILSMAMVLSLTVLSFADATTYTITIDKAVDGHTYEAYQIFAGDVSGTTLSNIVWGSGITTDGQTALGGNAAAAAESIKGNETEAKKLADTLVKGGKDGDNIIPYLGNAKESGAISGGKYTISGLEPGYYLVKDKANSLDNKTGQAYTAYILRVVGNVTVEPKTGVPQVEKKVKDINDSTDTTTTDWQDSADYDIGDTVPFQLTGTIGDNYDKFTTYKFIFHDNLSNGLTFNSGSVKVYVVNGTTKQEISTEKYSVVTTGLEANCDFEVRFPNLKTITTDVDGTAISITTGSKIVVEYNATLNGVDENGNSLVQIGSTGNPNEVYLEYSNNPNDEQGGETGKTPEDKVIVFTYKTVINKVRPEGNGTVPLEGAEFTLEKQLPDTDKWVTITGENKVIISENGTTFTFKGLDDGHYRLTETKTPAGYNTIDPIEFDITAEHDALSDNPTLTSLSGNATTGQITFTSSTDEGSLTADVINNAGTTLPETGGIGTTIFYVVGAVLVIGAGVLFVTKRRMSAR